MKLYFKQKAFKLKEDIKIFDENEAVVFKIVGTFLEIPKTFKVFDNNDRELASIETYYIGLRQYYQVKTLDGEFNIKKSFNPFKLKLWILENDWELNGYVGFLDFELFSQETLLMDLNKVYPSIGDRYELTLKNEEDALLAVIISIIVDRIASSGR